MGFLKLRLFVGLIFTATILCVKGDAGNNSNETIDSCLLDDIIPIHYNINVIPLGDKGFFGDSNVSINICRTILDIVLHTPEQSLDERAIKLIHNNGTIYEPMRYEYINTKLYTILKFESELSPGIYTLCIRYVSNLVTRQNYYFKGFYTEVEEYRVWLITNSFVSVSVRRNPMYFDDCVSKPTFNITVQHLSAVSYKYALSNMPMRKRNNAERNSILTYFYTTPPMSICTTMLVLFNLDRIPNANETVNMWCRSNLTLQLQFAQNVVESVAQYMIQYTNTSEKIPKAHHIAIPNLPVKSFSSWGLIVYNEGNITYDDSEHNASRKRKVAKLIAYEVIQQWFDNLVTPARWLDTWLSEGLDSFLQAYILDKIFENWRTMDFLVIENLHESLRMDTNLTTKPLKLGLFYPRRTNISINLSPFNEKAPVIIRMLQHITTEEVFRKGVIIYLRTHQFKLASSDDLWAAMQTALDESDVPHKDFKIKEVMDPWRNEAHYPLVTVTRNYETGEVIISQQNLWLQEDNKNNVIYDTKWWIPITYTMQTNPNFTNTALNFRWLSPKDENISLQINPNDWIILNLQQTGYYRVYYDDTNWLKIANYLNSEEYTKIHVLNRAQLIDDAFNLMYYDKLKPEIFFYISNYLWRETDYIAWYPMFQILSKLQIFFGLPESKTFKSHIAGTFNELLENVGFEDVPNEDDITRLKRLNARDWACTVGNALCLRTATTKLEKHLTYPDKPKLSPYWYQWIYCFGLKNANISTWREVWKLYQQTRERKLLEFLACSEHSYTIRNYLRLVSPKTSNLNKTERVFAFRTIIKKHARNDHILEFILKNFEILRPKSAMHMCDALREMISNAYSQKQLSKIKNFRTNVIEKECTININVMNKRITYIEALANEYSERIMKLQLPD